MRGRGYRVMEATAHHTTPALYAHFVPYGTTRASYMALITRCPVCGAGGADGTWDRYGDGDWCTKCVLDTLAEQKKSDTAKVKPEVFET